MPSLARRLVAEAFGTLVLVFCAASAVIANSYPGANQLTLSLAFAYGLAVAVAVSATVALSGGHLNPAVTAGMVVARRISLGHAAAYIAAQLVGAVLAGFLVKLVMPANVGRLVSWGTPTIANSVTWGHAVVVEAALTFLLVSAFFGTIVNPIAPRLGGLGVGLLLVPLVLIGGPLTDAALNPARAFGPALASGTWTGHLAYWAGPLIGGILAGVLWEFVLLRRRDEDVVVVVEG